MATITLNPGNNIQTLGMNLANDGDTIHLNDGVYQQQALTHNALDAAGAAWTTGLILESDAQYTSTNGALISGGIVVTGWTASGSNWFSASGVNLSELLGQNRNLGTYPRGRHRITCTHDELWLHHVGSTSNLQDTAPTGAAGNYFYDYGIDRLWISIDPAGAQVIVSTINDQIIGGPGANLTIQNLSVAHARVDIQSGAIGGSNFVAAHGDNWTIDNVEVFASHGVGIQLKSDDNIIKNSHVHHNGQLGIGCSPVGNPGSSGVNNNVDNTLQDTTIEWNNLNLYDPGHEAGAAKFAWTDRFTATHNTVRNNKGFGLWWDINDFDILVDGNKVHDNWGVGIFHEISFTAEIRFNEVFNNGQAFIAELGEGNIGFDGMYGICIAESNGRFPRPNGNRAPYGILVHDNLVYDNKGGIFMRQINRDKPDTSWPGGEAYHCHGVHVYNNDVHWSETKHGGAHDGVFPQMFTLTGDDQNKFTDNDYTINGTRTRPTSGFDWDSSPISFSQWQGTYGFDLANAGAAAPLEDYGVRINQQSGSIDITAPFFTGSTQFFAPGVAIGTGGGSNLNIITPLLSGGSTFFAPTMQGVPPPDGSGGSNIALERINVGGPLVAATGVDWEEDSELNPHDTNDDSAGTSVISNFTGVINLAADSLAAAHPSLDQSLFHTERYDSGSTSMSFTISNLDPTKKYRVQVFAAENFSGITGPGQRIFDLNIGGVPVKVGWDLWDEASQLIGTVPSLSGRTYEMNIPHSSSDAIWDSWNTDVQHIVDLGWNRILVNWKILRDAPALILFASGLGLQIAIKYGDGYDRHIVEDNPTALTADIKIITDFADANPGVVQFLKIGDEMNYGDKWPTVADLVEYCSTWGTQGQGHGMIVYAHGNADEIWAWKNPVPTGLKSMPTLVAMFEGGGLDGFAFPNSVARRISNAFLDYPTWQQEIDDAFGAWGTNFPDTMYRFPGTSRFTWKPANIDFIRATRDRADDFLFRAATYPVETALKGKNAGGFYIWRWLSRAAPASFLTWPDGQENHVTDAWRDFLATQGGEVDPQHVALGAELTLAPNAAGQISITTSNIVQSALLNAIEVSQVDMNIGPPLLVGDSQLFAPESVLNELDPTPAEFADVLIPFAQTPQVSPGTGDIADDIAIHASSWVIGTNNAVGGGLEVYNAATGARVDTASGAGNGETNNVDLRDDVVVSSNRSTKTIEVWDINTGTGALTLNTSWAPGYGPFGVAMYGTGASYSVFVTDGSAGKVRQFDSSGTLIATLDRTSECEGLVGVESLNQVYVSEENVGIWKFDVDGGGVALPATAVLWTLASLGITNDVEGLTFVNGFLIVSAQGNSAFLLINPNDGTVVHRFTVEANTSPVIDRTTSTDGIAALASEDLLVVHDNSFSSTARTASNYKFCKLSDLFGTAPGPPPVLDSTILVPLLDNRVGSGFDAGFDAGFGNLAEGAAQIFAPSVIRGAPPVPDEPGAPQTVTFTTLLKTSQLFAPTIRLGGDLPVATVTDFSIGPIWFDVLDPSDSSTTPSSKSVNRTSNFDIGQNDTVPSITGQVRNGNGDLVNLTSAGVSVAVFSMRKATNKELVVDKAAVTIDADQTTNPGKLTYAWAVGDTEDVGDYEAEFQLALAAGGILTVPNVSPKILIGVTGEIA